MHFQENYKPLPVTCFGQSLLLLDVRGARSACNYSAVAIHHKSQLWRPDLIGI